jgi:preprotein translocase subunit SecA
MAGRGTDIQLGGNAEMRIAQEIDPNNARKRMEASSGQHPLRSRTRQADC